MRAIIIDPWNQTVYATDLPEWGLEQMYEHLSGPDGFRKCEDINSVRLARHEMLWVDGEGLLIPAVPLFQIRNYSGHLAGKGLVLGIDEVGETVSTNLDVEHVKSMIIWTKLASTGELGPSRMEGNTFHIGSPILKERS